MKKILDDHDFILMEGAVCEPLRRASNVHLDPRLEHALLIYEETGQKVLSNIFNAYIDVSREAGIPIAICTTTWRANQERIDTAQITNDVNSDAVTFLNRLKTKWGTWAPNILIGGLVGCKNDCYRPDEGLSKKRPNNFMPGKSISWLMRVSIFLWPPRCRPCPRHAAWPLPWRKPTFPISSVL